LIAAVTGVLMLVVFKYTSNQNAIKRVRDNIKASLLSLKLFKDNFGVVFRAQGNILVNAFKLIVLSLVPMLVMIIPVTLIMTQLSLWYQARPLHVAGQSDDILEVATQVSLQEPAEEVEIVEQSTEEWAAEELGEAANIVLQLGGSADDPMPEVTLVPTDVIEVDTRVDAPGDRKVFWRFRAKKPGYHRLVFEVDGQQFEKELTIGEGIMRVSSLRPSLDFADVVLYPGEPPFAKDSPVQSIAIEYPGRDSWTSGKDMWVIYWFAISMVAALLFRKSLNVNI
jgi:hypothetical protein